MTEHLKYLKHAANYERLKLADFRRKLSVNLITNFTDDAFQKILAGVCIDEGIYPLISKVPYKQYHLVLKNLHSQRNCDVTFIFFDINQYLFSEFHSDKRHFYEILNDIKRYCLGSKGLVVMNSFILPYQGAYGILYNKSPLFNLIKKYNQALENLSKEVKNFNLFDLNKLVHELGESNIRDFRGLYAFDMPFSNYFVSAVCRAWLSHFKTLMGQSKKCIVLDLDDTLWGGIVGELGATNIHLGPGYPGVAFQNFQRALLDFYNRGIILAINSKNNAGDVKEVFKKNKHMILKENNFASIKVNWENKAENLIEISKELNIGLDSMVFIDNDPLNRELIREKLPEVLVPDFSVSPEEFTKTLFSLDVFNQLAITKEDKLKGKMILAERHRKVLSESIGDINEYISKLNISIEASINDADLLPRLSQLTLKTNQFNLTTKRYNEKEMNDLLKSGALIISGSMIDKFGQYGTVILAIIDTKGKEASLDSFLMSCRAMGRGVEYRFLDAVIKKLKDKKILSLRASFIPTAKNQPTKKLLADMNLKSKGKGEYFLDIASYYKKRPSLVNDSIQIKWIN